MHERLVADPFVKLWKFRKILQTVVWVCGADMVLK
jgi:hypothetical protein